MKTIVIFLHFLVSSVFAATQIEYDPATSFCGKGYQVGDKLVPGPGLVVTNVTAAQARLALSGVCVFTNGTVQLAASDLITTNAASRVDIADCFNDPKCIRQFFILFANDLRSTNSLVVIDDAKIRSAGETSLETEPMKFKQCPNSLDNHSERATAAAQEDS